MSNYQNDVVFGYYYYYGYYYYHHHHYYYVAITCYIRRNSCASWYELTMQLSWLGWVTLARVEEDITSTLERREKRERLWMMCVKSDFFHFLNFIRWWWQELDKSNILFGGCPPWMLPFITTYRSCMWESYSRQSQPSCN